MNVDLPGFDLNQDGKVDTAESFLSYNAYVDSTGNDDCEEKNDTKEIKISPKSQNQTAHGTGCFTATLVILAVVAIIALIILM